MREYSMNRVRREGWLRRFRENVERMATDRIYTRIPALSPKAYEDEHRPNGTDRPVTPAMTR